MAREKLTQEMVDLAIQYKGEGCTNGDIICMLGVAESTFYRCACHSGGRPQVTDRAALDYGCTVPAASDIVGVLQ